VSARWLAVAVLAVSATAHAEPDNKERAQTAFAAARQHYAAGDFLTAAHEFETAYALDPDPAYLFNIAQAYRFAQACADASKNYRLFLADVPQAPNRDKVLAYLKETDACVEKQALLRPVPPPPATQQQGAPAVPSPLPPSPPPRRRDYRQTALLVGGGGLVAIGIGVLFHRHVGALEDEREALCAGETPCDWTAMMREQRETELAAAGRRASIFAVTAYTVGGLALAGGVTLYVLGRRSGERSVVLAPTRGGGALAQLRFGF